MHAPSLHEHDGWPALSIASATSILPGRDVPGAILTNDRLSGLMRDAADMLQAHGVDRPIPLSTPTFPEERLGVRSRGVLDASWTSRGLAVEAARRALAKSGVDVHDVRCVLVSTVTPDASFPSLATSVHAALDLSPGADAFDITLGCSGFLAALGVAGRRLANEPDGSAAIVIGSETMVRLADATDRTTCTIFGDGAGAVVLRKSETPRLGSVLTWTLGEHGARIETRPAGYEHGPMLRFVARRGQLAVEEDRDARHRLVLDGRRVFRDMVRTLPEVIAGYLDHERVSLRDVDHVLFHQANRRMIDAIAADETLGLGAARVPMNIETVGNTASASIPILLAEAERAGRFAPGDRLLLVGFGSGYSIAITQVLMS